MVLLDTVDKTKEEICNFLLDNGFIPASPYGKKLEIKDVDDDCIGILHIGEDDKIYNKQERFIDSKYFKFLSKFSFIFKRLYRCNFIGTLNITESSDGYGWRLNYRGRNNLQNAERISKLLREMLGLKARIEINLIDWKYIVYSESPYDITNDQ